MSGLTLGHNWEPSPLTWPVEGDGHVRLFAALRPLRLRKLKLKSCVLEMRDVAALAEQLPELEELFLRCQLHPAALPLLARLPRLWHLDLTLLQGHRTDTWASSGAAVAAALMSLVLGAPCLRRVEVRAHMNKGRKLAAALREGVEWVQGS